MFESFFGNQRGKEARRLKRQSQSAGSYDVSLQRDTGQVRVTLDGDKDNNNNDGNNDQKRLVRASTSFRVVRGGDGTAPGGTSRLRRAETAAAAARRAHSPLGPARSVRVITRSSEITVKSRRRNLKALSGLRTLATIWIVLGHFQQTAYDFNKATTFVLVLGRGFIPVCMYIVLSGFVTHYAYRKKVYDNWAEVFGFYVRRVTRVLFTYYVSVFLGLLDPLFTNHEALPSQYPEQVLATVFLIQSWFELPNNDSWSRDLPTQPNPGGWTISTLLFAWILYPLLNTLMRWFHARTGGLVRAKLCLATFFYFMSMLPCIIMYVVGDGVITNGQFEFLYKFPPLRLSDFMLGAVLSELIEDPVCNAYRRVWLVLPELTTILFAVIVLFVHFADGIPVERDNTETFLVSGLSPLLGIILLGYSINSGKRAKWSFAAIFEHPLLIEFGNWSFAVYCFQFTIFYMFEKWQRDSIGEAVWEQHELRLVAPFLMPYLFALYFLSAFWSIVFETPFAKKVKLWTAKMFNSTGKETKKLVIPPKEDDLNGKRPHAVSLQLQSFGNSSGMAARNLSSPSSDPGLSVKSLGPRNTESFAFHSDRGYVERQLKPKTSAFEVLEAVREDDNGEIPPPLVVPTPSPGESGNPSSSPVAPPQVELGVLEKEDEDADNAEEEIVVLDDNEQIELELHIERDDDEDGEQEEMGPERYESDPEYETNNRSYDYIAETDSEAGEIEVDEDAANLLNMMVDTALVVEDEVEVNGNSDGDDDEPLMAESFHFGQEQGEEGNV